jgi:hypothetical protein
MINDRKYQDWIDCKRKHEPTHDFTHSVMNQIRQHDQSRRRPFRKFVAAIQSISTRWPAKLAAAAAVVLLGIIRLALSIYLSVE